MTVATFVQPSYPDQSGTQYPVNIDGAIAVLAQIGQQFAPHQAASPNMTVLVDAGRIIKADGTLVTQAQQTTAAFTAPVTNPRIDRIVIDQLTLAISVIAGAEAVSPTPPAIPAGKLPCAKISLQTTSTSITNAMITDERVSIAATLPATQLTSGTVPSGVVVPLGRVIRTDVSGPYGALDLGTVNAGDRILITATMAFSTTAGGGNVQLLCQKYSGTATINFGNTNTYMRSAYSPSGADSIDISLCGVAKVTVGGTLALDLVRGSSGTTGIVFGATGYNAIVLNNG